MAWPHVFQYNKRLLRKTTGGACLYMPQDGHWLVSFEVIPPPSRKKLVFPRPKNENSPLKTVVSDPKFCLFSVFSAKILSRRPRLSRTSRAPSRPIRLRSIDCDRELEHKVKTFPGFGFEVRASSKKVVSKGSPSSPDLHPKRSP